MVMCGNVLLGVKMKVNLGKLVPAVWTEIKADLLRHAVHADYSYL